MPTDVSNIFLNLYHSTAGVVLLLIYDTHTDRLTIATSPLVPRLDRSGKTSLLPSTYQGSHNPSPKTLALRSPSGITALTLYNVRSFHRPKRFTQLGTLAQYGAQSHVGVHEDTAVIARPFSRRSLSDIPAPVLRWLW